jgi:AMP-binding enzyme
MPDEYIALSDCLLTQRHPATRIAFHDRQYILAESFCASVKHWVAHTQAQPYQRYALYADDAYPFAVLLLALFHAGKEVWIAGNNRPGTAHQLQDLGCQLIGDWDVLTPFDYRLTDEDRVTLTLAPLNPEQTRLVIFTSGSTGLPKPIQKRLSQFQLEIATLDKLWGKLLDNAEVLSTVSHQHIYGLLFRVLWPLSTGRCFHSSIYLNPEILVNNINHTAAYWVASPAHLKRLDQHSPWHEISGMSAIFSSGGVLPSSAKQQVQQNSGQQIIEIYGSSETGGIGWRQQDKAWTLFPGMTLEKGNKSWQLCSPYLHDNAGCDLDDQLTLLDDGRFILRGRSDRIVKIEEKRLSLIEMEQRLEASPLIEETLILLVRKNRDVIAAVVVLTQEGLVYQTTQGRNGLIKQLRNSLECWFEPVVLPKKWLFVNTMPLTTQGKIDQTLLASLLDTDRQKFPQPLSFSETEDGVQLDLKVPQVQELIYFPNHFSSYPILPGVVQLAWVEYFGKLFFRLDNPAYSFSHLEVVKFVKIITPGEWLTLALNWKADSGELCFNFSSGSKGCSSGRMVYKQGRATSRFLYD